MPVNVNDYLFELSLMGVIEINLYFLALKYLIKVLN